MEGFANIKPVVHDSPLIKVIGVGGGGGNAVNRMSQIDVKGVELIIANTDIQDLNKSRITNKVQLGINNTRGLGAGAKPQVGREAALESVERIREVTRGADMVFITAGMGGGTGTGAAPIIAQVAQENHALVVGVVTLPFAFEGKQRRKNAELGVQTLQDAVHTLIVIPNENLLQMVSPDTSIVQAFHLADTVLHQGIQGISDLILNEGIINLDFADIRTIMEHKGKAVMGQGQASGTQRARVAAEEAIHSPLLNDCDIHGAKGILINVTGGPSMTLHEVTEAARYIESHAHEDADIIWGTSIQSDMEDEIMITVIATGFQSTLKQTSRPAAEKKLQASDFEMINEPLLSPGHDIQIEESPIERSPVLESLKEAELKSHGKRTEKTVAVHEKIPEPEFVETAPDYREWAFPKQEFHSKLDSRWVDVPTFIRNHQNKIANKKSSF